MKKIKENALNDFLEIISHAWTWEKLTKKEKQIFIDRIYFVNPKGTYKQRYNIIHEMYYFFLLGCGYAQIGWREENENTPMF